MTLSRFARFAPTTALFAVMMCGAIACNVHDTPRTPEETCIAACADRATRCTENECHRGCNMSLDRIIERELDPVIACVASANATCDDTLWAKCGTRVGTHIDGGPPAPPPAPEDD